MNNDNNKNKMITTIFLFSTFQQTWFAHFRLQYFSIPLPIRDSSSWTWGGYTWGVFLNQWEDIPGFFLLLKLRLQFGVENIFFFLRRIARQIIWFRKANFVGLLYNLNRNIIQIYIQSSKHTNTKFRIEYFFYILTHLNFIVDFR